MSGFCAAGAEPAIEALCQDYEQLFPLILKIADGQLILPDELVPLFRQGMHEIAARFRHAGTVLDNALDSVDPETAASYLRDAMIGVRFEVMALSHELAEHLEN